MRVNEKTLLDYAVGEGLTVEAARLDPTLWGLYVRSERLILLQAGMTAPQRIAALAHELVHHEAGHEGHQSPAVEAWVNEEVAHMIIDPVEYAFWESQLGWSTGGIAHALEVPRWVVEAYRRVLDRAM